MPLDKKRTREVFQKLSRRLSKLAGRTTPTDIHQVRTCSRRVEALLEDLTPHLSRNDKKLLKLLARLRRKAGRVRDVDVQIGALHSLRIPNDAGQKAQLLGVLTETRARREKKLIESIDKQTIREARKRLKRTASSLEPFQQSEAVALALRVFARAGQENAPLTEERLHRYRLVAKRARYIAEVAGNDPDAESIRRELKLMQDALGDWHDWITLTRNAEKRFGGVQESVLVAALRNVTRAKFRHAVDVALQTRSTLLAKCAALAAPSARKIPSSNVQAAKAAIA